MLVSRSVSNQLQKSTFIIVMMQTVVLQNKWPSQIRAINYNKHKSLSNSYKIPRLWANSAVCKIKPACEEHPFAPQHSSPSHGSTLVRNYLHWQGWVFPDKILRGLTFLSFGFDLQGLSDRALLLQQTHRSIGQVQIPVIKKWVQQWQLRTGSRIKHVRRS